jgi:hypothetical protein
MVGARGWRGVALLANVAALGCGYPSLDLDGYAAASNPSGLLHPDAAPGASEGEPFEPTETMNCGHKKVELQRRPADLVLVLDRSGSMLQNLREPQSGRFVQKWAEVVGALDEVIGSTQSGVGWGLKLFPHPDGCAVPTGLTVPVAQGNHTAILAAIRTNPALDGTGSTPTQDAIRKAAAALRDHPSQGSKYLVVATDGLPGCGLGGASSEDRQAAVAAVAEARAAGIPVFVMGIATQASEAHATLNQMAARGGRARGDATGYYPVGGRHDLVAALEAITGQVYACTFRLEQAPPAPAQVTVELDGVRVPRDPQHREGWDYGEGTGSLLLHGPPCERLKSGAASKVQILYGCPR